MTTCPACKLRFRPKTRWQEYCSSKCWPRRKPAAQHLRCAVCRREFTGWQKDQLYCGSTCRQRRYAPGRFYVLTRDGFRCNICGKTLAETPLHRIKVDLVDPKKKPTAGNVTTACPDCHDEAGHPDFPVDRISERNKRFGVKDNEVLILDQWETL